MDSKKFDKKQAFTPSSIASTPDASGKKRKRVTRACDECMFLPPSY